MSDKSLHSNKALGIITRCLLLLGIIFFGFVFPDSLSDHEKMVHFAAHMGMSFFIASIIYAVCTILLHIGRKWTIIVLTIVTLVVGVIYKYLEISGEGLLHAYSLGDLLKLTGCYTSMSQNISGLLAAILLIECLAHYLRTVVAEKEKEFARELNNHK